MAKEGRQPGSGRLVGWSGRLVEGGEATRVGSALSREEYLRNEVHGTAYHHAGEFFPLAAAKLRPGGVMTYFSCEIDTLSRGHQRLLLEHFDSFQVSVVRGLEPPVGCQYWWASSMVVVEATGGRARR